MAYDGWHTFWPSFPYKRLQNVPDGNIARVVGAFKFAYSMMICIKGLRNFSRVAKYGRVLFQNHLCEPQLEYVILLPFLENIAYYLGLLEHCRRTSLVKGDDLQLRGNMSELLIKLL